MTLQIGAPRHDQRSRKGDVHTGRGQRALHPGTKTGPQHALCVEKKDVEYLPPMTQMSVATRCASS